MSPVETSVKKPFYSCNFKSCARLVFALLITSLTVCTKTESLKQINTVNTQLTQRASPGKPNIILILGDDVGYEIPTVDGGNSYSTPNIDKMAQIGMMFTQCHASPLCSPSRFML